MPAQRDGAHRPLRLVATVGAALSAVLLAGCDLPRLGVPDPATKEGGHIASLWSGFLIAAAGVTLLIWVLLAWVLIRYRRGRDDHQVPSQQAYHIPLEILYTVIPVVAVVALFAVSVHNERKVTAVEERPAVRVEVIGFQWSWQFTYADGFTVTAPAGEDPVLVLPVGQPVNLHLVSVDVIHSFWVPHFLEKRDLIPGVDNTVTVRPTRTGTFVGRCAEFCGLDHWRMQLKVKVVSADDYATWVADQKAATPTTATPTATTPTTATGGSGATTTTTGPGR